MGSLRWREKSVQSGISEAIRQTQMGTAVYGFAVDIWAAAAHECALPLKYVACAFFGICAQESRFFTDQFCDTQRLNPLGLLRGG